MKKKLPRDDEPWRVWPLLWWRRCQSCGQLFRWEWLWAGWWAVDRRPTVWLRKYVCTECAPHREDARPFFGLWRPRPKPRPKPPAPPPGMIQPSKPWPRS